MAPSIIITPRNIGLRTLRGLAAEAAKREDEAAKAARVKPVGLSKSDSYDDDLANLPPNNQGSDGGSLRSPSHLATGPIVTMIAGPNGSGKSTLVNYLRTTGVEFGQYINTHEIDQNLPGPPGLERLERARAQGQKAVRECLMAGKSFAFETVMAHRSKIEILREARARGYQVVLYFVALESFELNVERVRQRVAMGGHAIPEELIGPRYNRGLQLLPEASKLCDRIVLFDNSYKAGRDGNIVLFPFCEGLRNPKGNITYIFDNGRVIRQADIVSLPRWSRHIFAHSDILQ